jgi:hypothetical protein
MLDWWMTSHHTSDTLGTSIKHCLADLYNTYTMYHPLDVHWHVLNDTMSQYYLHHHHQIFGLYVLETLSPSSSAVMVPIPMDAAGVLINSCAVYYWTVNIHIMGTVISLVRLTPCCGCQQGQHQPYYSSHENTQRDDCQFSSLICLSQCS